MRYINTLVEGETIRNIYLCKGKRSAETRNGKPYDNLILQDKTGTLDGKVWDPNSNGIADYDEMDFIEVFGDVISYNNNPVSYTHLSPFNFITTSWRDRDFLRRCRISGMSNICGSLRNHGVLEKR